MAAGSGAPVLALCANDISMMISSVPLGEKVPGAKPKLIRSATKAVLVKVIVPPPPVRVRIGFPPVVRSGRVTVPLADVESSNPTKKLMVLPWPKNGSLKS